MTNRISNSLDSNPAKAQAGFRSGFSTIWITFIHYPGIREYKRVQKPLCKPFIDYETAFDSVEIVEVTNSIRK